MQKVPCNLLEASNEPGRNVEMRKFHHQMIFGWMLWLVAVPAFSQNLAIGHLNVKPGSSVEFVSTIGLIADRYGFLVSAGDNRFRYSQPEENPPLYNLIRSNLWTLVITSDPSPEECEFPHSDFGHYGYPGLFMNGGIEPTGEPGERTRRLREICWIKKPLIPKGEGENPSLQTGRPCSGSSRNTHEIVQDYEIPRLQRGSVTITAKIAAKLQELFGLEFSVGTTITIYERRRVKSYTRTVDGYTCTNGTYRHVGSYIG